MPQPAETHTEYRTPLTKLVFGKIDTKKIPSRYRGGSFFMPKYRKRRTIMDFETLLEVVTNDERSRKVPILFIIQILTVVDDKFRYLERED